MAQMLLENEQEEIYIFENFEDFEKILKLIDEFESTGEVEDNDLASSFLAVSNPRIFNQKIYLKKVFRSL